MTSTRVPHTAADGCQGCSKNSCVCSFFPQTVCPRPHHPLSHVLRSGCLDSGLFRNSIVVRTHCGDSVVTRTLLLNPSWVVTRLYSLMMALFKETVREVSRIVCAPEGTPATAAVDVERMMLARARDQCGPGKEWAVLAPFFDPRHVDAHTYASADISSGGGGGGGSSGGGGGSSGGGSDGGGGSAYVHGSTAATGHSHGVRTGLSTPAGQGSVMLTVSTLRPAQHAGILG